MRPTGYPEQTSNEHQASTAGPQECHPQTGDDSDHETSRAELGLKDHERSLAMPRH